MNLPKVSLPKVNLGSVVFALIIPLGVVVGYFFSNIQGFVSGGSKSLLTPVNKLFYVAKVDGVGISKAEWETTLKSRYGKNAASELIDVYTVRGELAKSGITVSEEEITAEIATVEKQLAGQSLEEALKQQGRTLADFRNDVYLQVGIRKLLGGKVSISDEEITAYVTAAGAAMGEVPDEEKRAAAKQALTDQKLSEEVGKWFTDLRGKVTVENYLED
jgi:parvulin-like peptidyl-prolyl isomerase